RHLGQGAVAMAFLGERLRVVLASEHVPLRRAVDTLSRERLVEVTGLLDAVCVVGVSWRRHDWRSPD
ncbi:MAG: 4-hydroxythreonine-4-phosphate dehydrogenase PdxA, partial [Acidobacteriota bacterium]